MKAMLCSISFNNVLKCHYTVSTCHNLIKFEINFVFLPQEVWVLVLNFVVLTQPAILIFKWHFALQPVLTELKTKLFLLRQ